MTALNDLKYLLYSEWISSDYNVLLKKSVLPVFSKRFPLKLREIRILSSIVHAPEHPTSKDISVHLREDPATITRSAIILTGNEYITSEVDAYDGRNRRLVATEKGIEASAYFLEVFSDITAKQNAHLKSEHQDFDDTDLTKSLKVLTMRVKSFLGDTSLTETPY